MSSREFMFGIMSCCAIFTTIFIFISQFNLQKCVNNISSCDNNCNVKYNQISNKLPLVSDSSPSKTSNIHEDLVILLWTPIDASFDNWDPHFGPDWRQHESICTLNTSLKVPVVTSDRRSLGRASLVIFNLKDLNLSKYLNPEEWASQQLPKNRPRGQIWALFWRQTPIQLAIPDSKLEWLDNLFNWTISYRRDSDIFYPFGLFQDLKDPDESTFNWHEQLKRKNAVWYSNKCNTSSQRETLVKKMETKDGYRFATFLYGKCVDRMPKIKLGKSLLATMKRKIRYYLALEEDICDDYITEQYFRALSYGYVPVVFGGADLGYDEVGLAGTYIDALDFENSDDLVQYLTTMQANSVEFVQYLAWQQEYRVVPATHWVCDLLTAIHRLPERTIKSFSQFWNQKKCYGSYDSVKFSYLF